MSATVQRIGALAACFVAGIIAVCWRMEIRAAGSRDPEAMANRLDQPETKIARPLAIPSTRLPFDRGKQQQPCGTRNWRFSFQADRGDSPSPLDLWSRRL